MKVKISVAACAVLALFAAQANAADTVKLQEVEVNSVGDNISESGISEGILNKGVASGPLAGKKVLDMPYQVNTMSIEAMNHQGVAGFEDAVKYFPSAQIQTRGGVEVGRPQTRGFQGSVVGNVLWDGFYSVSTTAIPMYMFEGLQIQNGLAGSLYGGQDPAGIFNYTRKRPVPFSNTFWADYTSRSNFGVGWDTSDKFQYVGYRGVFYKSGGARQAKNSDYGRNLASLGLDFYLTENFTIETNFSYYKHKMLGMPGGFWVPGRGGVLNFAVPDAVKTTKAGLEQEWAGSDLKTTTASVKFKYAPTERWYFEGGYQWQKAIRDMYGTDTSFINSNGDFTVAASGGNGAASRFDVQSWFAKATTEFETLGIEHNFGVQANGYIWTIYGARTRGATANLGNSNLHNPRIFSNPGVAKGGGAYKSSQSTMKNLTIADDIKLNDYFSVILSAARSNFENKNKQTGVKTYDESGTSYAASFIYRPVENVSLYFTYADSLQAGSSYTYERTNPRYGETVVLKPFRSKQYEIGAKARIEDIDLSTALYEIKRPIAYLGDNNEYSIQGEQVNRGLEFTAGGKITNDLSVMGGVALIQPKLKKAKQAYAQGKIVVGEPKVQSNLLFDYVVPNTNKLALSANLHYTGKRYADQRNVNAVPAYFTTDLGIRYVTKEWLGKQTTLRFNVNNVFDKRYWVGMFPSNIDGTSNGTGASLFLGQSRTFMLSAEVKF